MATLTRGGRRVRKSKLASASYTELKNEMIRRQEQVQHLITTRERLAAELRELEAVIESVGGGEAFTATTYTTMRRRGPGRPPGSGRGRPKMTGATPRHGRTTGRRGNAASLADSLVAVLTGKTLGVSEAADAVKRAGYKTTSPNFRTIVNAALLTNRQVVSRFSEREFIAIGDDTIQPPLQPERGLLLRGGFYRTTSIGRSCATRFRASQRSSKSSRH
jgi:hypothetical protein